MISLITVLMIMIATITVTILMTIAGMNDVK